MVVASVITAGMDVRPRIIAAEVKNNASVNVSLTNTSGQFTKPHIAGELDLLGETTSEPHWVEVKDGRLVVYPGVGPQAAPIWHLPLRHLNLQPAASGRPRGFSLSKHGDPTPIATFQVGNDYDYKRWVKTLAAELMRQTPLEAVRFLDILGITATIPAISHSTSPPREVDVFRSVSPESELRTWLRCSSLPERDNCCVSPLRQMEGSCSKGWFSRTPETVVQSQQPLSLIVTKDQGNVIGRSYTSPPSCVDVVDGTKAVHAVVSKTTSDCESEIYKSKFRSNRLPLNNKDGSTVRSLLKSFSSERILDKSYSERRLSKEERLGRPPLPDVVKDLPPCDRRSRTRTRISDGRVRGKSVDVWSSEAESGDEAVAGLIARCQQVDKYVPVREKRLMFESLCRRAGTRFSSSDNINEMCDLSLSGQPRTQSLHDLSKYNNNVAVKEICRYFEQRVSPSSNQRQLQRAEKKLSRLRQNITEAEGNIWRLQDQSNKLNQSRRSESTRIQQAVEERMTKERDRLKKFQEEVFKIQQEINVASDQFGIAASKGRHSSNVR